MENSKKQEVTVVETTVVGIECTEKNGEVSPHQGLVLRGELPKGFTPVAAIKKPAKEQDDGNDD